MVLENKTFITKWEQKHHNTPGSLVHLQLWTQPQHLQEKALHPCNLAPMHHSPLRKNVQMRAAPPGEGICKIKIKFTGWKIVPDDNNLNQLTERCISEWSSGLYSSSDFACYKEVLKHATCRNLCKIHTQNLLRSWNSGSWCNLMRISNRVCYQLNWIVSRSISLLLLLRCLLNKIWLCSILVPANSNLLISYF